MRRALLPLRIPTPPKQNLQVLSLMSTMALLSIQNSKVQMFQPILKQKDNQSVNGGAVQNTQASSQIQSQSQQVTNANQSIPTQGAHLRKQGSGSVPQKNQTSSNQANVNAFINSLPNSSAQLQEQKQIEELKQARKAQAPSQNAGMKGQTFNYEDVKRRRSRDLTPNSTIQASTHMNTQDTEVANYVETKMQRQRDEQDNLSGTESERNEQRLRPSLTKEQVISVEDRASIQPPFISYQNNQSTVQSFQVFHETQRTDGNQGNGQGDQQLENGANMYEVIQEEVKDDSQFFYNRDENVQNSDFKRFNIDEDYQNLRIKSGLQQQQNQKFNPHSFQPSAELNHSHLTDNYHTQQYLQQTENLRYQNNVSGLRNDNEYGFQLDESSLKGSTHLFMHSQLNVPEDQLGQQSFLNGGQDQNQVAQSYRDFGFNLQAVPQNDAHILSFSQNNQYVMQLQEQNQEQNNQDSSQLQINQEEDRPLSPTAEMQQRRLHEILKSSQTDTQSLNNSVIQDKMDEKQLNNMIDIEKNFVIIQYENILQQLNTEFQKLLQKTKDQEEQMQSKDQVLRTQAKILQNREDQQFQLEQLNRQLNGQVQELLAELEVVTVKQNQRDMQFQQFNDEQLQSTQREDTTHYRVEKEYLESRLQQFQSKISFSEQTERELREQLEALNGRLRQTEQKLRLKDEELFQMSIDNTTLQRDQQNLKELEHQMRLEIQSINGSRFQLENEIQEIRQQLCTAQIQLRQKDNTVDQLERENRNLRSSLEILQISNDESMREIDSLKDVNSDFERAKIQMKAHMDSAARENSQLKSELDRLRKSVELEREHMNDMESHLKGELHKLMTQNKQLQQSVQNAQQEKKQLQDENQRKWESFNKKKISFQDEGEEAAMHKGVFNQKNQQPLQETHNTFFSPQRAAPNNKMFQQATSPKQQDQNGQIKNQNPLQKSQGQWPFLWGGGQAAVNQNLQNNQSYDQGKQITYPPPKTQNYPNQIDGFQKSTKLSQSAQKRDQDERSQGRRNAHGILNQNESSQLQNIFSWDKNGQKQSHQHHFSVGSRSMERKTDLNSHLNNSRSDKMFDSGSQPFKNSEQSEKPLISWLSSTSGSVSNFNAGSSGQFENTQSSKHLSQSQSNLNMSYNQFRQGSSQDQDMQPAGKNSNIKMFQSPFAKKEKVTEAQISHLQNSLSSLQIDKERLENDFRKIGHAKNKQQIEKKQELEFEVEIVSKNIQNIKQKLRELHAFQQ